MGGIQHKYTDEEREFIRSHTKGISSNMLSDMFYDEFGVRIKPKTLKAYRARLKLNSGLTGRFEKGHVPYNKGMKQTEYMSAETIERTKATRFKKGQLPVNHRPVGSERITVDGYTEIKIKEPGKWMLKSKYVYEKHYGKVPKGCVLVHKNGIRNDDRIENLVLMTKGEVLSLNQLNLMGKNEEINEAAINLARLNSAIGKRKRGINNE